MHHDSGGGGAIYVVLGVLIVIMILRRRGISQTPSGSLNKGERQRPILITWLDPLISILFVGSVLWGLMTRNYAHAGAALVGALVGVPIGLARARVMYVRAVREAKCIILRRSPIEYTLLAVLLALRLSSNSIANMHNSAATYVLTAVLALGIVESIVRASAIVWRYHHEAPAGETV
jgi:hypothetical protein